MNVLNRIFRSTSNSNPNTPSANDPAGEPGTAPELVQHAISTYPVVIFSKSYCPFCISAKADISKAGKAVDGFKPPRVYELDHMAALGRDVQAHIAALTGRRTVPSVFIGGKPVGGGDELAQYAASGVLRQMLAQAPASLAATFGPPKSTIAARNSADAPADAAQDPAAKWAEESISGGGAVVIFSKTSCPFCEEAKATLSQSAERVGAGAKVTVLELDTMGERGAQVQAYLAQKTGQKTVPNVFVGGKHIGGWDNVEALQMACELDPMVEAAVKAPAAQAEKEAEVDADADAQAEADAEAQGEQTDERDGSAKVKEVVVGAGCFWGVELAFQRVEGVLSTEVGYSNGKMAPLTYEAVCTGATGAAEVVRIKFDEDKVSLGALLAVWESRHDVTSLNKQGNDVGTQYRSALFYFDEGQRDAIDKWRREAGTRLGKEVVTEIAAVDKYCAAEEYHQRYLEKKGQSAAKGATTRIRCYG